MDFHTQNMTEAIDAWLDCAREDLTEDQYNEFVNLIEEYEETQEGREGEPEEYHEQDNAAWIAALEHVEGELDVAARGQAYRDAKNAAYAGAVVAALSGVPETRAAEDATINRMTLRKLLGKS